MGNLANGRAHLELEIQPKFFENAINRFLSCSKAFTMNEISVEWSIHGLEFLPPAATDPRNCLHFRVALGIGGALTGDIVVLKLFLDGENNRKLRVGFVRREQGTLIDLIEEFRVLLMLVDASMPGMDLPLENLPIVGSVDRYFLKCLSNGNALLGIEMPVAGSGVNENQFHQLNNGLLTGAPWTRYRFGFSVDHDLLRDFIIAQVNNLSSEDAIFSPLQRDSIRFSADRFTISGRATYSGPCLTGDHIVDFDINYSITIRFTIENGDLVLKVGLNIDFADLGEEIEATICGIVQALSDGGIPFLFIPVITMIAAPFVFWITEDLANAMAGQNVPLESWRVPGLLIQRQDDTHWNITLQPVGALKMWGGLFWPMRMEYVNVADANRITLIGSQDLNRSQVGVQEANFRGVLVPRYTTVDFKIHEHSIGVGYDSKALELYKTGDALIAICGWEIVDDTARCFYVDPAPCFTLPEGTESPLLGEIAAGSKVVSPQNRVSVSLRFGPTFQHLVYGPQGIYTWKPFIPQVGDHFQARLLVHYKIRDANEVWQQQALSIPLEGVLYGTAIEGPEIELTPDLHGYFPNDEILRLGDLVWIEPDIWTLPDPGPTYAILNYHSIEPGIAKLEIFAEPGQLLAQAMAPGEKSLSLFAAEQKYQLKASLLPNIPNGHAYGQRQDWFLSQELEFASPIIGFEMAGAFLVVAETDQLSFYQSLATNEWQFYGTVKTNAVRNVHLQFVERKPVVIVTETDRVQLIHFPDRPKGKAVLIKRLRFSDANLQDALFRDQVLWVLKPEGMQAFTRQGQSLGIKWALKTSGETIVADRYVIQSHDRQMDFLHILTGQVIGSLKDLPDFETMKVQGRTCYLFGKSETHVITFRNAEKPVLAAWYPGEHWSRRFVAKGDVVFAKDLQKNKLLIYRSRKRPVRPDFIRDKRIEAVRNRPAGATNG